MTDTIIQRPKFHLTPPYGFANDIQPFFYKNGEWHIYYLWNGVHPSPDGSEWRQATTKDWVNFEDTGVIIPKICNNRPIVKQDVATGSIIKDHRNISGLGRNTLLAYSTSFADNQAVNLWYADGNADKPQFRAYYNNPILRVPSNIQNSANIFFRDPYVFSTKNTFTMIISEGTTIGVYRANDGIKFQRVGEISKDSLGSPEIIECPMIIKMATHDTYGWPITRDVLFFSGRYPNNSENPHVSGTWYIVGKMEDTTFKPETAPQRLDHGPDFYGSRVVNKQSLFATKTYAVGWMSGWDYAGRVPGQTFWHSMSMRRRLKLEQHKNGYSITSQPANELSESFENFDEGYHGAVQLSAGNTVELPLKTQGTYAATIEFDIGNMQSGILGFTVRGNDWDITWQYDIAKQSYNVKRYSKVFLGDDSFNRYYDVPLHTDAKHGKLSVTLYVDTTSIELFTHDRQPFTMARYGEISATDTLTLNTNVNTSVNWHVLAVD